MTELTMEEPSGPASFVGVAMARAGAESQGWQGKDGSARLESRGRAVRIRMVEVVKAPAGAVTRG